MLSYIIAQCIMWFNSTVDSLCPVFGIGDNVNNIVAAVPVLVDFLSAVNFVIPLPTIALIIVADMAIRFSGTVFWIVNWIVLRICDLIP